MIAEEIVPTVSATRGSPPVPSRLFNLTPPRIVPNPVEEVMAFPGQRANAESPNAVIRVLDAAVTKVTSFERELAEYPSILRLVSSAQS